VSASDGADAASAQDRLIALATELSDEPDVDVGGGRGFGSGTLQSGGRIFAMAADGQLVLKLPASRVSELVAAGRGAPFSAGKPRPLREWVAVTGDGDDWLDLGREALDFARASRAG
jgi:hypothetical protein